MARSADIVDLTTERLCRALRQRRHALFVYEGVGRAVEPHILGYDHHGRALMSAWQLLGGSGAGFRTYHLDAIPRLTIPESRFTKPRPGYNPDHGVFAEVVCQL